MLVALQAPPPPLLSSSSSLRSQASSKLHDLNLLIRNRKALVRRRGCRAELAHDAPFVAAIGACVLTSLVSPIPSRSSEDPDDGGGAMDSTDTRFAVMGIVSFIPYFNWLAWVFAWLDSGKQRYLIYSIVYLAPYLRTNLSLSPEESWLPIASIVFCILHVQLEASIRNGDIKGFQFFHEIQNLLSPRSMKKENLFESSQKFTKEKGEEKEELPFTDGPRNKFRERGRPFNDAQHQDGDSSADEDKRSD
ncbi:hypothetical protein DsansV1_C31g0218371 [Dioscorea sansibarensis]